MPGHVGPPGDDGIPGTDGLNGTDGTPGDSGPTVRLEIIIVFVCSYVRISCVCV